MKYKLFFPIILASVLLACNDAEQQQSQPPVEALPEPAPVLQLEATPAKPEKDVSAIKIKQINTQITPEMIEGIRFDASGDAMANDSSRNPLSMNPQGKTQIMVKPKVFLNESDELKTEYIDYIDGAAVELEVKFD
jgi:vancomycin resistance protein YoaR